MTTDCATHTLLRSARTDCRRGELIAAGVRLRESVRRYLQAVLTASGCRPEGNPCAGDLSRQIARLELLPNPATIRHMIELGNRAAHCEHLDASELGTAIGVLESILNGEVA